MQSWLNKRSLSSVLCGLALLCAAGCSGRSNTEFIPAEDYARSALEKALTAWQNGQPPHIMDVSPAVEAVDRRWKNGAKLANYEILTEESHNGAPSFSVKLTLKQPASEKTVLYIVVGKDPLWVYSEEEYNM